MSESDKLSGSISHDVKYLGRIGLDATSLFKYILKYILFSVTFGMPIFSSEPIDFNVLYQTGISRLETLEQLTLLVDHEKSYFLWFPLLQFRYQESVSTAHFGS